MGIFPQVKGGRGDESDAERVRPQIERESVTFARSIDCPEIEKEKEESRECNK